MLEKRAAHLVRVVGDNGVQAWPCTAPLAGGEDGDAVPRSLRSELVARELGRQPGQFRWCVGYHVGPAGIMMCPLPRRSVVAVIVSLPAAALDVLQNGRTGRGIPRQGSCSRASIVCELGLPQKYELVL